MVLIAKTIHFAGLAKKLLRGIARTVGSLSIPRHEAIHERGSFSLTPSQPFSTFVQLIRTHLGCNTDDYNEDDE
jgi:hypothetical protein